LKNDLADYNIGVVVVNLKVVGLTHGKGGDWLVAVPVCNSELAVPHGPGEVGVVEGEDGLHVTGVHPVWTFLQNPSEMIRKIKIKTFFRIVHSYDHIVGSIYGLLRLPLSKVTNYSIAVY
jgi:hypothetical protein